MSWFFFGVSFGGSGLSLIICWMVFGLVCCWCMVFFVIVGVGMVG